jgi:hypothetical protein
MLGLLALFSPYGVNFCMASAECGQVHGSTENTHVVGGTTPNASAADSDAEPVNVELRTDKDSYKAGENIIIEVLLTNRSGASFYVYNNLDWGESASLSLWIKDESTGKSVPQHFYADALTPPPNSKADFMKLLPRHVYGVVLKTTLDELGLGKSGKYELIVNYHSPIPARFGFGLPIWGKEKGSISSKPVVIAVTN